MCGCDLVFGLLGGGGGVVFVVWYVGGLLVGDDVGVDEVVW